MAKKQGKKQRIAFRKNRENRARQGDLTRDAEQAGANEDLAAKLADLPAAERLTGKGQLSRSRTVIVDEDGDGALRLDVDAGRCQRGRVLSAIGLNSRVQGPDGSVRECTVRRLVRTMARDARNAVVAGDWVLFQPLDEQFGVIERVEPRHGVLSRGSRFHEHILVANVDQVVIVVSVADPPLKPGLIDRFLISAESGGTRAMICVNKADLTHSNELQSLLGLYARLGYQTVQTSAATGEGISRLRTLLKDRQSVFAGQSGVGKSSLLNAVQPGLALDTGAISEVTHKGKHTTRRAELIPLQFGGWVVDTPGIRQLELWNVRPDEVEGYYPEFRPFVARCRFPDCSHTHETECQVKRAVGCGLISQRRYQSYLRVFGNEEPLLAEED